MAAFPYQQQQPFHLDSLFLSNTAFKMFDLLPERVYTNPNNNNNPTLFPSFQSDSNGCYQEIINEYCLSEKTKSNTDSSSIVDSEGSDQEKIITTTTTTTSSSMEKKRKHRDGSCMNSTTLDQIKQDGDRAKTTKKQRKINVEKLELTKDKKCNKDDKRKKKNNNSKAIKDLPTTTGYVHVRARRGQATDSHSLAERVRREKISERLKMLQDLVPGCDKVNSKAVMLEEIINYVQSLQHQVEMLSLKLASMNPMVYDFGVDLDAFLVKPEDKLSTLGSPTSFQHLSSIPIASTTFANGTNNNVPLLDSSSSVSFSHQQDQRLSDYLTHSQGHEDLLWHVGYQRQGFINQLGATNWCSFQ